MATTPTVKQRIVLDALDQGKTLWNAMNEANVSLSPDNRASFLMRLVDNGYLTITVTPKGRQR